MSGPPPERDTALVYIHSPRYAELGPALERLPVTVVRYPYNVYMVLGHLVPFLDRLVPAWMLWRIRRLPHRHKVVLSDRLLRVPWFVDRLREVGCRYVIRLRGDAWREHDEVAFGFHPDWSERKRARYRHEWFHNLEAADAVWPMSEHLAAEVARRLPGTPTAVIRSAKRVPPAAPSGTQDGADEVLTASVYFFRGKTDGVVELFDLMEPVLAARGDLRWTVVGGGRYFERVRERWARSPARDRIALHGRVRDLDRRMARARCLVYHSRMDVFPNVVVDALAAGLPVLCNRWGPFPEIFTGPLAECLYDGPEDFAELLGRILADAPWRAALAAAGRERVRALCDPDALARRVSDALDAVAALEAG